MTTMLWRQAATALRLLIAFTIICGIAYPLLVFGVAHIPGLANQAEGSVITSANGTPVGSSLIGVDPVAANPAADPYFHTRPSASASDALGPANTTTSGGSNKSTVNPDLLATIDQRRALIAQREGVAPALVPAYAQLQEARITRVTGLPLSTVQRLVAASTSGRMLGFLGEPTVNVTELNLAVQQATR
jgi:K+-transporting ATPase ATPase C chain